MVGVLVFGSETKLSARFSIRVVLLWLLVAGRILLWCKGIPLRVPYLPDPQNTGPTVRARLAVLAEFRRRFPEVELEAFSGISIPGMELESRLMLAIAGGMAPDVFSVNLRMSDTYIQQGFLWPLDEFVAESYPGGGREEYLSLAPQALWPVLAVYLAVYVYLILFHGREEEAREPILTLFHSWPVCRFFSRAVLSFTFSSC